VPAAVSPAPGSGAIQLELPAGEHEVLLEFKETPVHRAGETVSALAVAAALLVAWRLPAGRRRRSAPAMPSGDSTPAVTSGAGATPPEGPAAQPAPAVALPPAAPLPRWAGAGLCLGILAVIVVKVTWAGPLAGLIRQAVPVAIGQHPVNATIGGQVALLGYDLDSLSVAQGSPLHLRLYWQAREPLGQDYASFVQLTAGPTRQAFAGADHQHPGSIPSGTWPTSQYVIDEFDIPVPADTPPVAYQVAAGLYRSGDGDRLGEVELPTPVHVIELRPPAVDAPAAAAVQFENGIALLDSRVQTDGSSLTLTLYWKAGPRPAADAQVFVHLLSADGQMAAQGDSPPVAGLYPTSLWRPGQVIADVHTLPLPAGGLSGPAQLRIGLYDLASGRRVPVTPTGGGLSSRSANVADDAIVIPVNK
jgi:hypothetical protein